MVPEQKQMFFSQTAKFYFMRQSCSIDWHTKGDWVGGGCTDVVNSPMHPLPLRKIILYSRGIRSFGDGVTLDSTMAQKVVWVQLLNEKGTKSIFPNIRKEVSALSVNAFHKCLRVPLALGVSIVYSRRDEKASGVKTN